MDEKINSNSKLKEFLGVMRPQSKGQTWNEEASQPATTETSLMEVDEQVNTTPQTSTARDIQPAVQKPVLVEQEVERETEMPTQVSESQDVDGAEATAAPDPSTDADWMRSRTSRLLGLLDDDEEDAVGRTIQKPEPEESSRTTAKHGTDPNLPVLHERPAEAPVKSHSAEVTAVVTPEEGDVETSEHQAIGKSGRLFLRNLAYTITEDDLRSLFDPSHNIEEVSMIMRAQCCVVGSQRMNILIGTAYAQSR